MRSLKIDAILLLIGLFYVTRGQIDEKLPVLEKEQ